MCPMKIGARHSFSGPERDFRPSGAPTNRARRPTTTQRRWARHEDFKPDRAAHTQVQFNGMVYQKGLRPPPRDVVAGARLPRPRPRPALPHRTTAAAAAAAATSATRKWTGIEERRRGRRAAEQWSRSRRSARAGEGGCSGGGEDRGTFRRTASRRARTAAASLQSLSPRRARGTTGKDSAAHSAASPTRRGSPASLWTTSTPHPKPSVFKFNVSGKRHVWGTRAMTPAEIVAEIRSERQVQFHRKLAGMMKTNESSLGNTMPGNMISRSSGSPRRTYGTYRPATVW